VYDADVEGEEDDEEDVEGEESEESEEVEEGRKENGDDDEAEHNEREHDGHEHDDRAYNNRQHNGPERDESKDKSNSGKTQPTDEDLATNITAKIKKGLEKIKKKKGLPNARQPWPQASDQIEEELWAQAEEVSQSGKELSWMLRYLASCFALVRMKFASDAAEIDETYELRIKASMGGKSAKTRDRWRCLARMVNGIVDGLYESWASNAYLVCFALAGKSLDPNCGDCLIRSQQRITHFQTLFESQRKHSRT
jgi:hypothetical protein